MSISTPTPDPADISHVAIRASSREQLRDLFVAQDLDYGCRPMVRELESGRLETHAYVADDQLAGLQAAALDGDLEWEVLERGVAADRSAAATVGQGNRFEAAGRFPQGLGTNPDQDLGGIMTVDEINAALDGLAAEYPDGISTFQPPHGSHEGETPKGGQLGGIDPDLYHIFFIAGVHARERGGPDNLIYFIADLLHAQKYQTGVTYGNVAFTYQDVIRVLEQGIVFYPLVNPDGVRFDQATNSYWRKNRSPVSATPGNGRSIGVDLNRNYDFLWDFPQHFHPSFQNGGAIASNNPAADTFHGPAPFSEPETRNVVWCLETFRRIRWFMDIHSYWGNLLIPWGDDVNQTSDPGQEFRNPGWDGQRGLAVPGDYQEFITSADLEIIASVASRTTTSMRNVAGSTYGYTQAFNLYPTSGTSDDFVFSRYRQDPELNKIFGFTLEFGFRDFYPTPTEFKQNILDTGAGFMQFCLAAADFGHA